MLKSGLIDHSEDQFQQQKRLLLFRNGIIDKSSHIIKFKKDIGYEQLEIAIKQELRIKREHKIIIYRSNSDRVLADEVGYLRNNEQLYISLGEKFDEMQILNQFETIRELGKGGFGKVDLCRNIIDEQLYAVKQIMIESNYDCHDVFSVFQEASNLKVLNHEHIVKINNFLCVSNRKFVMVTEYCEGGELSEYIEQKGRISEKECQRLFRQIISAIQYIHRQDIVHRDIKCQNILFGDKSRTRIKLVDFGLAGIYNENVQSQFLGGSLKYMAPELLSFSRSAHPSQDVWSLGCVLYKMVHGDDAFKGDISNEIVRNIKAGNYSIDQELVSEQCQSLIRSMLQKNPVNRIRISDVLNHSWITETVPERKFVIKSGYHVKASSDSKASRIDFNVKNEISKEIIVDNKANNRNNNQNNNQNSNNNNNQLRLSKLKTKLLSYFKNNLDNLKQQQDRNEIIKQKKYRSSLLFSEKRKQNSSLVDLKSKNKKVLINEPNNAIVQNDHASGAYQDTLEQKPIETNQFDKIPKNIAETSSFNNNSMCQTNFLFRSCEKQQKLKLAPIIQSQMYSTYTSIQKSQLKKSIINHKRNFTEYYYKIN